MKSCMFERLWNTTEGCRQKNNDSESASDQEDRAENYDLSWPMTNKLKI